MFSNKDLVALINEVAEPVYVAQGQVAAMGQRYFSEEPHLFASETAEDDVRNLLAENIEQDVRGVVSYRDVSELDQDDKKFVSIVLGFRQ